MFTFYVVEGRKQHDEKATTYWSWGCNFRSLLFIFSVAFSFCSLSLSNQKYKTVHFKWVKMLGDNAWRTIRHISQEHAGEGRVKPSCPCSGPCGVSGCLSSVLALFPISRAPHCIQNWRLRLRSQTPPTPPQHTPPPVSLVVHMYPGIFDNIDFFLRI